jgi:glutamate-1-semialdehyde 2,1-aminomutase
LRILQDFVEASETLLVLDEVYSLRLDFRGAHTLYNLKPDLIAMGKIIGGGLPIGAVGGSSEVMSVFEPRAGLRMVPHGGTFNANPMSMSAGLAAMRTYTPAAVTELNALGQRARTAIREAIAVSGIEAQVTGHGSLLAIRFNDRTLRNYRDVGVSKIERAQIEYFHKFLLNSGILAAPQLLFVMSTPMRAAEIDRLAEACLLGFRLIAAGLEEAQYSSLDSLA